MQFWPSYTRYFAGDFKGEGSANLDVTIGGSFTERLIGSIVFQQNFDKDIKFYTPSPSASSGPNDWNIFANLNWYF